MSKKDTRLIIIVSAVAVAVIVFAFILRSKLRKKLNCKSDYFFIGDSTTAHSNSYADQLRKICGANVKKISKSGAKTDWMLNEMNNHFSMPKNYDVVTILSGSNDIFARLSIDQAKVNMEAMLNKALNNSKAVVLIAPPSKAFYTNTTDQHRELINQWEQFLKGLSGKYNGKKVHYIDLPKTVNKQEYFASDNQHMNTTGHQVLLKKYIDTLNIKTA